MVGKDKIKPLYACDIIPHIQTLKTSQQILELANESVKK